MFHPRLIKYYWSTSSLLYSSFNGSFCLQLSRPNNLLTRKKFDISNLCVQKSIVLWTCLRVSWETVENHGLRSHCFGFLRHTSMCWTFWWSKIELANIGETSSSIFKHLGGRALSCGVGWPIIWESKSALLSNIQVGIRPSSHLPPILNVACIIDWNLEMRERLIMNPKFMKTSGTYHSSIGVPITKSDQQGSHAL